MCHLAVTLHEYNPLGDVIPDAIAHNRRHQLLPSFSDLVAASLLGRHRRHQATPQLGLQRFCDAPTPGTDRSQSLTAACNSCLPQTMRMSRPCRLRSAINSLIRAYWF